MTVPEPPIALTGHCSVISGNTLYAYSSTGFLSIPLKVNGTWIPLNGGVSVSNAVCLKGGIDGSQDDDEALYVVGGTATNSNDTYSGLQRFSFKDQKWQTLGSAPTVVTDWTGHGAAFVASNSSIIVYAGNQGDKSGISCSSYRISTAPPYVITSELDHGAPCLSSPQLLPWNSSHVGMFGGDENNLAVYTYSISTGWANSPVSLRSGLSPSTPLALFSGSGDSKVLEYFNMDASPNSVVNYELISSDGKSESPAVAVGSASKKRSTGEYPTYNDTLAPSNKWSDYALAQGSNGMVVLSSGQSQNALVIFNQTSNSWVNSTELFQGKSEQHVLTATTTTSTTMTPTATPTTSASTSASATPSSTTTAAAAAGGSSHTDSKVIIGATLGSACGVALILLLILWLLKRERIKREQNGQARGGDNKDRLSFQDQGIEPLANRAYPMAKSPVPFASMSVDSLAIMSGKYSGEKALMPPSSNLGYGLSAAPRHSKPLSPIPSSGLAPSSMYSEDAYRNSDPAPSELGHKPGDRTTDEGWGKYFQDNRASNLAGMPSDRSTTSSVYTKSDYRGSAWPMSNLAPLNLGFLDQPKPLGRVNSGSPTTEHASSDRRLAIPESQSARISSADSISIASDDDPHDTNWTGAHQSSWLGRPPSSNYSTSFYDSSTRDPPGLNSQLPRHSNGRRSSVVIPSDIDELPTPGRSNNVNSDMSWLNLQAER
ncbi:uncharacterized protein N7482_007403 [Penicillium canariense]|uniref:Pre-mRNA splicing factor CLF1 n=1 Tax=Penicillium canariense TaxID=189055 RepID=A0A9W9LK27_9EURO|nr:uncharacterized protein N7482_007403 [Penicillium canariense]KAJ5160399.1 hypothetical protein N7482_007403 [Penicillium canariense]